MVSEMNEFREIFVRMQSERASLTEKHPDRWVVMGKEGVVTVGDSMDEVLEKAETRGLKGSDMVVEFLDTSPPVLIL